MITDNPWLMLMVVVGMAVVYVCVVGFIIASMRRR